MNYRILSGDITKTWLMYNANAKISTTDKYTFCSSLVA